MAVPAAAPVRYSQSFDALDLAGQPQSKVKNPDKVISDLQRTIALRDKTIATATEGLRQINGEVQRVVAVAKNVHDLVKGTASCCSNTILLGIAVVVTSVVLKMMSTYPGYR